MTRKTSTVVAVKTAVLAALYLASVLPSCAAEYRAAFQRYVLGVTLHEHVTADPPAYIDNCQLTGAGCGLVVGQPAGERRGSSANPPWRSPRPKNRRTRRDHAGEWRHSPSQGLARTAMPLETYRRT